jgi:hypothetical protein
MTRPLALIATHSHIEGSLLDTLDEAQVPCLRSYGCADATRAWSQLLSDGLRTDADVFVLLSPDLSPSLEQALNLVGSRQLAQGNAVTGYYWEEPTALNVWGAQGRISLVEVQASALAECVNAGLGFAAFTRRAVESIAPSLPELIDERGQLWRPYFLPVILQSADGAESRYLSAAEAFWWRLRAVAGVELHVDRRLAISRELEVVLRPARGAA